MLEAVLSRVVAGNIQKPAKAPGNPVPDQQGTPVQDRGVATEISLSQEALDHLSASPTEDSLYKSLQSKMEVAQINARIHMLDAQEERRSHNEDMLARLQASYAKMASTPPKAAVELTKDQIAEVLKKAEAQGYGKSLSAIGSVDNVGIVMDGKQYNFHKDGTVTMQDEGVATSLAQQQKMLASMQGIMDRVSKDLADTSQERSTLVAQRDALLAA